MRMRQKKCDALANKKGGAPGPGGSFAKSDVPQHPAQSGGENLEVVLKTHLRFLIHFQENQGDRELRDSEIMAFDKYVYLLQFILLIVLVVFAWSV